MKKGPRQKNLIFTGMNKYKQHGGFKNRTILVILSDTYLSFQVTFSWGHNQFLMGKMLKDKIILIDC